MIFKNKVMQSREERNALAISDKNPWVVSLKCSFQDSSNLYLVMEYLPGGDLMNLLMKKDIFTHEEAQFYTA
jgi:serine/threonine kinase 38